MRKVVRLFLVVVTLLSLLVLFLFFKQDALIYFPRDYTEQLPPGSIKQLKFVTSDGTQTAYFRLSKRTDSTRLWILFGGNGSLARDWDFLLDSSSAETSFLMIEYPGYGESEGRPSPKAIRQAAQAALMSFCETNQISPDRVTIGVMGHSLGAATALNFALDNPVDKIILVAPFTSLRDMARRRVGMPLDSLLRTNFDNIAALEVLSKRTPKPLVTIIHGKEDYVVPVSMGRKLALTHPGWIDFHEIEGAGHDDVLLEALELITKSMRSRRTSGDTIPSLATP